MERIETLLAQLKSKTIQQDGQPSPLYNGRKYEGTNEQWQDLITYFYQKEAEKRGHEFIPNEQTNESIKKVATWITSEKAKPSIMLSGGVGNGKTTLASATLKAINSFVSTYNEDQQWENNIVKPCTMRAQDIAQLYKDETEYNNKLNCKFLIIDDLGCEPPFVNDYGTKKAPMTDLIYDRYIKQKTTFFTTNLTASEMGTTYGERVYDRLKEMCEVVIFTNKTYRK